jgi:hypothetical protein
MTHPNNVPDAVSADLSGLSAPDELIETLTVAGCALRHAGAPLEVYLPTEFDDDDFVETMQTFRNHDYVVTNVWPQDGGDFKLMLEVISLEASSYGDQR